MSIFPIVKSPHLSNLCDSTTSNAAAKFHELKLAQELLIDPLRRADLDASLRKQRAHKEKYAKFDAKRKAMQDDLEEREREFKRAKMETVKEQRERVEKEAYIRDQGRRIREEREMAALMRGQASQQTPDFKLSVTEPEETGERMRISLTALSVAS